MRRLAVMAVALLMASQGWSATRTNVVASGLWTNAATWSGGVAPTTGDSIVITNATITHNISGNGLYTYASLLVSNSYLNLYQAYGWWNLTSLTAQGSVFSNLYGFNSGGAGFVVSGPITLTNFIPVNISLTVASGNTSDVSALFPTNAVAVLLSVQASAAASLANCTNTSLSGHFLYGAAGSLLTIANSLISRFGSAIIVGNTYLTNSTLGIRGPTTYGGTVTLSSASSIVNTPVNAAVSASGLFNIDSTSSLNLGVDSGYTLTITNGTFTPPAMVVVNNGGDSQLLNVSNNRGLSILVSNSAGGGISSLAAALSASYLVVAGQATLRTVGMSVSANITNLGTFIASNSTIACTNFVNSGGTFSNMTSTLIWSGNCNVTNLWNAQPNSPVASLNVYAPPVTVADFNTANWVGPTLAIDASGNRNTGTNINQALSVVGTNGGALQFNGSSQYVTTAVIPLTTYTLSAWVKPSVITGQHSIIGDFNSVGNIAQGCIDILSNSFHFVSYSSGGSSIATLNGYYSVLPFVWLNPIITFETNGTFTLYVNGTYVGSAGKSGTYAASGYSYWSVGRPGAYDGQYFNGSIDDVRIYNRALSSNEVVQTFNWNAPTNGLVGYWPMNDTNSIQSNTGTNINLATSVVGTNGRALQFNGSSQYVSMANTSTADNLSAMSVSAWIKTSGGKQIIVEKSSSVGFDTGAGWYLAVSTAGKGAFIIQQDTSHYWAYTTDINVNDGNWHPFTVTFNGTGASIAIYVDGVSRTLINSSIGTPSSWTNSNPIRIGDDIAGKYYFNGSIDDVRIYNRALSSNEIVNVMNFNAPTNGLIGYWPLDDYNPTPVTVYGTNFTLYAAPVTVADLSGNGNTGSNINGAVSASGAVGTALNFVYASSQRVQTYNASVADNLTNMTVACWMKTRVAADNPNNTMLLVGKFNNPGGFSSGAGWGLGWSGTSVANNSNQVVFSFQQNGSTYVEGVSRLTTPYGINDGNWHHLAWVKTNNVVNGQILYIDGLVSSTNFFYSSGTVSTFASTNGLALGWDNFTTNTCHDGSLDDIRIYNRALSSNEVILAMSPSTATTNGLVGYWPLDEGVTFFQGGLSAVGTVSNRLALYSNVPLVLSNKAKLYFTNPYFNYQGADLEFWDATGWTNVLDGNRWPR